MSKSWRNKKIRNLEQIYNFMKDSHLIDETLSLNEGVPLFDFNVNFTALKKLLVDFNVVIDDHREQINELRMLLRSKADKQTIDSHFAQLNGAFNLSQLSHEALKIAPQKKDTSKPIDSLSQKCVWVMGAVDKLLYDSTITNDNANNMEKRMAEKIKSQNKKMQDKFANLDDTMKKNMELYFKDANSSFIRLESRIKDSETANLAKLGDILALVNRKVNQQSLKGQLDALENRIDSSVRRMLEADGLKRASNTNDIDMRLKDSDNLAAERQNQLQQRLADLMDKVNRSLSVQGFEKEKVKIYEKLGEQRGRIEDLAKRAEDYIEYKRATIIGAEKSKQQTMALQDDIGRLKDKADANTSLGNSNAILQKIDPHKICELDAAVRLHSDLIAKLQKAQKAGIPIAPNIIQTAMRQSTSSTPKGGLGSQQVRKFIKEYLTQLDLQARIKKVEKDMHEFSKRVDSISELEKKLFAFTKQFDFGSITRQLSKKCYSDETRREVKMTNGRIDQLHEFFKMIRKDLDQITDIAKKNEFRNNTEPTENALLTGKKLYPIACLSCYSGTQKKNYHRRLKTPGVQPSIEFSESHGQDEYRRVSAYKQKR